MKIWTKKRCRRLNRCLSPKILPSLLEIAASNPDFTLLNAAVSTQPDIMNLIEGDGPFTIFAPVNSAFEKWLEENNLSAEEAIKRYASSLIF